MFSASSRKLPPRSHNLVAAVVAMLILASGLTLVPASPASAVSFGPGFTYGGSPSSGWLGGYYQGGSVVYCIDPGVHDPAGHAVIDSGVVSSYTSTGPGVGQNAKALTSAELGRLNLIISKWGQTSDPVQAAAVSLTVRSIANPAAYAAYTSPWGDNYYSTYNMSSAQWTHVKYLAAQFRAEAAAFTPTGGTGAATMTFEVDAANNYDGMLTITTMSPANATATIILTNGAFLVTGTDTFIGAVTAGMSFDVHGVPPVPGDPYKIEAAATFLTSGSYAPQIHLWQSPGRQSTAGPGGFSPASFTANAVDPFDRSVGFQPILTSQVEERYLGSGDPLIDNVVFSIQADENGVVNEWATRTDGLYFRIVAKGTVYGPFTDPQAPASDVPAGAPVAGTATITTTSADGPTVTYTATADNPATSAGYYVWVWEIDYDNQPAATKVYLPAPDVVNGFDGYYWADDFGIHAETAIVVAEVVTAATPTSIAGYPITDTATVTGAVFVGAELGFEAYLQVDDVPTCTVSTLAFTSTRQAIPTQGDYTSEEFTPALGGTYFWVETLYDDTGAVAHRGVCGEPLETTIVDQFVLTTVATQSEAPGAVTADTATLRGVLPTDSELMFSAYYSETSTPVCLTANLVYTTATPISVPAGFHDESKFTSATFTTTGLSDGYLFWVESLTDDTGTIIGAGECGAVGEITALRTLASTGMNAAGLNMPITAGVLLLLCGLLATIAVTRRRAITTI